MSDYEAVELAREHAVRGLLCRVCGAPPGKACVYPVGRDAAPVAHPPWSHVGRYDDAVRQGLVPAVSYG